MTALEWRPVLGPGMTACLALVLIGAMVALQRRSGARGWSRVVRLAAFSVGAFLLLNPVGYGRSGRWSGRPVITILVDASRSMSEPDVDGGSRYQAAVRAVAADPAWAGRLARRFDVRYRRFDGDVSAADRSDLAVTVPDGAHTDLARALEEAARGGATGSRVILASDGRDTAGGDPEAVARALRNRGIVVDTLPVGRARERVDAAVVAGRTQLYARPGQPVNVGAVVRTEGVRQAGTTVTLGMDGAQVATRYVQISHGTGTADLTVKAPGPGVHRLVLSIAPPPGDCNSANDRAQVLLTVGPGRVRTLYLDGKPSWDSAFLVRSLSRDSGVALDVVYRLTPGRFYAVLSRENRAHGLALPRTAADLARYDVVILGKGVDTLLDRQATDALKEWVTRQGGAVLLARGAAGVLRDLDPLEVSGSRSRWCRVVLPDEARDGSLPVLDALGGVGGLPAVSVAPTRMAPWATVLAVSDPGGQPVIAYGRQANGTVMTVAAEGMWGWAFADSATPLQRSAYDGLWSQTVHWLATGAGFAPGQDVAIRADRSTCEVGDEVRFSVLTRHGTNVPAQLLLRCEDGSSEVVATSREPERAAGASAVWRPKRPGDYVAHAGGLRSATSACGVTVVRGAAEDLDRSADADLMRRIAAAGGGRVLFAADLPTYPDRVVAQAERDERNRPLRKRWDTWPVLLGIAGMLCVEWWARRRTGKA